MGHLDDSLQLDNLVKTMSEFKDVHTEHCCLVHGCKYGDDRTVEQLEVEQTQAVEDGELDYAERLGRVIGFAKERGVCTVLFEKAPQSFPCESCQDRWDGGAFMDSVDGVMVRVPSIDEFLSRVMGIVYTLASDVTLDPSYQLFGADAVKDFEKYYKRPNGTD